jgi:hypothetical protein
MTDAGIREQLAEAAAGRRLVRITRREPLPRHELNVLPLALGSELLLFQEVNPDLLLPDGFSVLRLADVEEVDARNWERVVERALSDEGRLPQPDTVPVLPLDGWQALLAELRARGERVVVECEEYDDEFFLGPIAGFEQDGVEILPIDTAGRWEDDTWTVEYDGITRVSFGTRYIQVFSRHAGESP